MGILQNAFANKRNDIFEKRKIKEGKEKKEEKEKKSFSTSKNIKVRYRVHLTKLYKRDNICRVNKFLNCLAFGYSVRTKNHFSSTPL